MYTQAETLESMVTNHTLDGFVKRSKECNPSDLYREYGEWLTDNGIGQLKHNIYDVTVALETRFNKIDSEKCTSPNLKIHNALKKVQEYGNNYKELLGKFIEQNKNCTAFSNETIESVRSYTDAKNKYNDAINDYYKECGIATKERVIIDAINNITELGTDVDSTHLLNLSELTSRLGALSETLKKNTDGETERISHIINLIRIVLEDEWSGTTRCIQALYTEIHRLKHGDTPNKSYHERMVGIIKEHCARKYSGFLKTKHRDALQLAIGDDAFTFKQHAADIGVPWDVINDAKGLATLEVIRGSRSDIELSDFALYKDILGKTVWDAAINKYGGHTNDHWIKDLAKPRRRAVWKNMSCALDSMVIAFMIPGTEYYDKMNEASLAGKSQLPKALVEYGKAVYCNHEDIQNSDRITSSVLHYGLLSDECKKSWSEIFKDNGDRMHAGVKTVFNIEDQYVEKDGFISADDIRVVFNSLLGINTEMVGTEMYNSYNSDDIVGWCTGKDRHYTAYVRCSFGSTPHIYREYNGYGIFTDVVKTWRQQVVEHMNKDKYMDLFVHTQKKWNPRHMIDACSPPTLEPGLAPAPPEPAPEPEPAPAPPEPAPPEPEPEPAPPGDGPVEACVEDHSLYPLVHDLHEQVMAHAAAVQATVRDAETSSSTPLPENAFKEYARVRTVYCTSIASGSMLPHDLKDTFESAFFESFSAIAAHMVRTTEQAAVDVATAADIDDALRAAKLAHDTQRDFDVKLLGRREMKVHDDGDTSDDEIDAIDLCDDVERAVSTPLPLELRAYRRQVRRATLVAARALHKYGADRPMEPNEMRLLRSFMALRYAVTIMRAARFAIEDQRAVRGGYRR